MNVQSQLDNLAASVDDGWLVVTGALVFVMQVRSFLRYSQLPSCQCMESHLLLPVGRVCDVGGGIGEETIHEKHSV